MDNNEKTKERSMQRELQKLQAMTTPGYMALGLGLYGKFAAHGNAFHPLLNNENVVLVLLGIGVFTVFWGGYRVMKITKAHKQSDVESI